MNAGEIIEQLRMSPLPVEGGYYSVNYLSDELLPANALPERYQGDRATRSIFLKPKSSSRRCTRSSPMRTVIRPRCCCSILTAVERLRILGCNLAAGQRPQITVLCGATHGSRPLPGGKDGYSFLSTSMAQGYSEDDVTFPERAVLLKSHSSFSALIMALTRTRPVNA